MISNKTRKSLWSCTLGTALLLFCTNVQSEVPVGRIQHLTIYSGAKDHLIKPIMALYEKKTGTPVDFVIDNADSLIPRLQREKGRNPADVFIANDVASLVTAENLGLLASADSPTLREAVPARLRSAGLKWFGLVQRPRTIVYNTRKVKTQSLRGYESLADPAYEKRVCLRSARRTYNTSLIAMLLTAQGEATTERLLRGWLKNLAVPVFEDDQEVLDAMERGICDLGVVNSYYWVLHREGHPETSLRLYWPPRSSGGVHVNLMGAGIIAASPHRKEALRLLEWLTSIEGQSAFASLNREYPVNPSVAPDASITAWGSFEAMPQPVSSAGENQQKALDLIARTGWK